MKQITQLEISEARIEAGLSQSTALPTRQCLFLPMCSPLSILSSKQAHLSLKPGFESSARSIGRECFVFVFLCAGRER